LLTYVLTYLLNHTRQAASAFMSLNVDILGLLHSEIIPSMPSEPVYPCLCKSEWGNGEIDGCYQKRLHESSIEAIRGT